MRFCQPHWDALRTAIEKRGMGSFIARSGEEAMAHTVREIDGETTVIDFEPLMSAHWALVNLAGSIMGPLHCMVSNDDGSHRCPVCEIQSFNYVDAAADMMLLEAQQRGLLQSEPGRLGDGAICEGA